MGQCSNYTPCKAMPCFICRQVYSVRRSIRPYAWSRLAVLLAWAEGEVLCNKGSGRVLVQQLHSMQGYAMLC